MSQSAGGSGAYGILVSAIPEIADVHAAFIAYVNELDPEEDEIENGLRIPEFAEQFREALRERLSIIVPKEFGLVWTGSGDDRPADCSAPEDDWVLGFGIFTLPWMWPKIHKTFRAKAQFYNWAWVG